MILTDEEAYEIAMITGGCSIGSDFVRYVEAAVLQKLSEQEPVAIVGDVYQLLWFGSSPIAAITSKHGIKVGDKLYTIPPPPEAK